MAKFRKKTSPVIKKDDIGSKLKLPFKFVGEFISGCVFSVRNKYYKKNPRALAKARKRHEKYRKKLRAWHSKLSRADKKITRVTVNAVNAIDSKTDAFVERADIGLVVLAHRFYRAKAWVELNKKLLLCQFAGLVGIVLCCMGIFNICTAYEYSYNGRSLGLVNNQEDVLRILDLVSENLTEEHNAEITIDKDEDIDFKRVFSVGKETDNMEQVLNKLTYMQDLVAQGYGIFIDNKRVAIVDNEETANAVLDAVLAAFAVPSETTTYEEIGFAEDVSVTQVETRLGLIENPDDVVQKILTGAEEIKTHVVQSGDTFSGIAKTYNISTADLQAANPLVTPERLVIGQEIILTQAVPMLTVQTVEVSTLTEYLQFETVYEDNPSVYQGETNTKVAGQMGERQVMAKIVKNNGVEVARMELESHVTKEPVTAVISVGTKELPPKQGTGTFIYPVTGAKLTSRFGMRWGRMHYGIDLAIATGTKIRASDGGTVIFSGYSGSYGYVVKIDHGGGFVTVYAHCSKLHVKVGEKVYQGQHIANVGSTGRSTGPHCHFEVQYLGVQKNPLNYL